MKINKIFATKENENICHIAQFILQNLTNSKVILLNGELGSGKTTLLKQIALLINITEPITSPTFNYMKTYKGLVHIDAYNLSGEIDEFVDYKSDDDILAVEWPNKVNLYYTDYVLVNISLSDNNEHIFEIKVVN
ncbi:tRNA (adenosine(37)-N6)-threonylcarbamoyltransferase complex ATPase subunit type 1 TsaE [Mycoplasmopsis primatum]|uniref:tRNA (adenosine(37)-N6)-threonylcarbamoyltransferase complex ATPase subunit type 1 TsaE n=1 Tax=Mycoplasmopsis primatum TaxID=55604 RepID=UPI0004969968|nr:tRNA (adenosine(37)-N6)-threonylcarbamoyltransferase complex ATPase subunit type 1 TsaE [Mycoplasmopsis primatum]